MNTNTLSTQIYEQEKVFGDENMLTSSYKRLDKMFDLVRTIKKPTKVLDLGCGTGFFASKIKDIYPSAEVYGIDISKKALNLGRKKYKNITFIRADAEQEFPFKNNFFDLIISGEHIEHLKDTDTYLIEINRVMKKGGTLILTTPNLASWMNRILLLFGKQPFFLEPSLYKTLPIFSIGNFTFPETLKNPPSGHLRLFTLDMLEKLLSVYGFEAVAVKGANIFQKPLFYHVDLFFSYIPSLAFGVIIKVKKVKNS